MSSAGDWVRDLADAADELGYGIVEIGPSVVRLGGDGVEIEIRSRLLSGTFLRGTLKPLPKREDRT